MLDFLEFLIYAKLPLKKADGQRLRNRSADTY